MARAVKLDPYNVFRFGVSFNGQIPMGFCTVEICPKAAHSGAGQVVMTAAVMAFTMEFLNQRKRGTLDILAYHRTDECGVDGKPSMTFRLHGVQPSTARLKPIKWDAAKQDILVTEMTLDYERLEMLHDGISAIRPQAQSGSQPIIYM